MGPWRTPDLATHWQRAGFIAAALPFALAVQAAGPAAPPHPEGLKGAVGAVVEYDERAGANIVYLQEKGGMVTQVAPPVSGPRKDAKGAPAREEAPAAAKPTPSAAARSLAKR